MTRWRWRLCAPALAVALLGALACRVTDLTLWRPAEPLPDACPVEAVRGVAYRAGAGADGLRHRLDLYLPKGRAGFPVVVLVHGGAWVTGDNRCCGLVSSVGEFLAGRGIAAVLPNYRLSPGVRHPEHLKDVARAFAWTRAHLGAFGGRPDQLFLVGHSAGGHLVALLATDERYLRAEGLRGADVRGVVAVSGVYDIRPGKLDVTLGGDGERAFRLDELIPLRGAGEPGPRKPSGWSGLPLRLDVFGAAFGDDPKARADASPLYHVRPGLPPFLLLSAENELPALAEMAVEFQRALAGQGCDARLMRVAGRNHNSILFRAVEWKDPVARALVEFVRGPGAGP
jgi:acetyl esterase/lipase